MFLAFFFSLPSHLPFYCALHLSNYLCAPITLQSGTIIIFRLKRGKAIQAIKHDAFDRSNCWPLCIRDQLDRGNVARISV